MKQALSSSSNGLDKRPKLRFPGFDESWKATPFGELVHEFSDRTKEEDEDTLLSAAIEGMFLNTELFGHQRGASNKGYKKIKYGTMVLSTQNLHLGNANVNQRFEHGMVSPAYKTYEITGCSVDLMAQWIKSEAAKRFFYNATTVGASVCRRNVEWDTLYEQPLYLPSIAEQDKLAKFLTLISDRITKQQQYVSSLKKYKRGLLRSYFMTDEWNTHSKWDKCKLGPCCSKIGSGKTPRGGSSVYVDHGVTFLRSQNVLWGTLDLNDVSYIDEETNNTMLSSEVRCGDVLLNITGASIGRSCIYSLDERANVNQHVCILRLSQEGKERLLPEFLLQQILSDRIQQQVMDCQNGGSREGLNFQQISDFNIVIPDMREQRKICGMLNAFDQRVSCEETALHTLLDLRAALMQQLFI